MPIKLILNPSKEEALRMYPKGDHPHRYLKSPCHQANAGNNLAGAEENEQYSEDASTDVSDDRTD